MPLPSKTYNSMSTIEGHSVDSLDSFKSKKRRGIVYLVGCIASAILISAVIIVLTNNNKYGSRPRRNVIMMISDGFGPASETYARQYHQWREGLTPKQAVLPLDSLLIGSSRTQSTSSLVTDSAAGATAFACATKSFNGAIGVTPDKQACGTVLESAKHHHGMLTGLVVTSRVSHATPASFSAHAADRNMEPIIAQQQIGMNPLGRSVDLMFGGGACAFLSNTTQNSCREDSQDLFEQAQHLGWSVHRSRQAFDALAPSSGLPLMGIFTPQHMSYEIDRDPALEPSLKEMTAKALTILSQQATDGFFLMIEGSRIDMAAHSNDPAAHVHEILMYQQTVDLVKAFVESHPETVLISTSDHETGGLTVARQVGDNYPDYKWNPEIISHVKNSSEVLANTWRQSMDTKTATVDTLKQTLADRLGVMDPTQEELDRVMHWSSGKIEDLATYFSDIVSRRALIGWTTWGHTAVDVNLYAMGSGTDVLRGNHENTDIGDFMVDYLGLDLKDMTTRLAGMTTTSTSVVKKIRSFVTDHARFNT